MGSADITDGITLPDGYSARAATLDDAEAVARLRNAYQADEGDTSVTSAEEQLNDWLDTNIAEDTLLIFAPDGGCDDATEQFGVARLNHGHLDRRVPGWGAPLVFSAD